MDHAELLIAEQTRDIRIKCPACSADRRKSHEKTLSITVKGDRNLYDCHHCGYSGAVPTVQAIPKPKPKKVTSIPTQLSQDERIIREFFEGRGVTIGDMSEMPAMTTDTRRYFHGKGESEAIGFVYGPRDNPDAIKWRALKGKAFTQEGSAADLYGLELLEDEPKEIIIVEGEADVVALKSIGINSVSHPNGAPIKVSRGAIDPSEDHKFAYVWENKELFEKAEKIILATDADEPGNCLAEELARRIDRAKCYRVQFPEGTKDPTDVLRDLGADKLREVIEAAEPLPLSGVYTTKVYTHDLYDYYQNGHGAGESTGIASLDDLFTLAPGRLIVVTGVPSSGKSEFVDQIAMNLAMMRGWKWAVASFENPPAMHMAKMAEKIMGKPFYEGKTPRMARHELDHAVEFMNKHTLFLENRDGRLASIDSIITRTKQAVMRLGVRGLIIDPYNYIARPKADAEHVFISEMLTELKAFLEAYGVTCFFVAHPQKMQRRQDGTYPVPKGMDISGSMAWYAKADIGLTVNRGPEAVEIHCWKARFKWEAQMGVRNLYYDIPTGRYFERAPFGNKFSSKPRDPEPASDKLPPPKKPAADPFADVPF